ncbi:MAG: sensor histidine kinase [Clostridiales bacterium]|nr:sensor histidine kinase [Clostridiales bacterium]
MKEYNQEEIRLLTEVLPQVAAQLRGSLGNIYSGVNCLASPEERDRNVALDQNAAILTQSYYRILRVVNNLSSAPDLLRTEKLPLQNQDLVKIVSDLCEEIRPLTEEMHLTLLFRSEKTAHLMALNRSGIRRMLFNLLSNAIKFTPAGGLITVTLRFTEKQALLLVADTGCGIRGELQDTIFDRCLHTERCDPLPHGLGLGLPLSRRAAEGHGGQLMLESRENEGTTVSASLPNVKCPETNMEIRDLPFHYAGGFNEILLELSDALPFRFFVQKNLD